MPLTVFTSLAILKKGIELLGLTYSLRVSEGSWIERFRAHYGSTPSIYAKIFRDLQTTTIPSAKIEGKDVSIKYFLMSVYFLRCYPTELQLGTTFKVSEKTARKWTKFYVNKIRSLQQEKIVWPRIWQEKYIVTVDGTHCRINEPQHPTLSRDPTYYSHKLNGPAVNYEIALSIFRNKIVWVNGPFPAATHDLKVYQQHGLKQMIPVGKKVVADLGYKSNEESHTITIENPFDSSSVKVFKIRCKARQEGLNRKVKVFQSTNQRFNHSIAFHGDVFVAVCVIIQYELDDGISKLYDV